MPRHARIVYTGTYTVLFHKKARPLGNLSLRGVIDSATSGGTARQNGAMTITLVIDGAAATASLSRVTGPATAGTFVGTYENGRCYLTARIGQERWEGPCGPSSFVMTVSPGPRSNVNYEGVVSATASEIADLDSTNAPGPHSSMTSSTTKPSTGHAPIDYAETEKSGGNATIFGVSEQWPAGKPCSIGDCLLFDFTPRRAGPADYKRFGQQVVFGAQRIVMANGNGSWGDLKILGIDDSAAVHAAGYSEIVKAQWFWQSELYWPVYFKFVGGRINCYTMHGIFDECRRIPTDGDIQVRNWTSRISWPSNGAAKGCDAWCQLQNERMNGNGPK